MILAILMVSVFTLVVNSLFLYQTLFKIMIIEEIVFKNSLLLKKIVKQKREVVYCDVFKEAIKRSKKRGGNRDKDIN